MAYDPKKAAAFNAAISQGLSEDEALKTAGISDNEVSNYSIDEVGSQNPQDRDYNPNYGQLTNSSIASPVNTGGTLVTTRPETVGPTASGTPLSGVPTDGIQNSSNRELTLTSTRRADREAQERAAAEAAQSANTATAQEKQSASSETAADIVKSEERTDFTGTDTPVDEEAGEEDVLSEEEQQNLDNPTDFESFGEQTDPGEATDTLSSITSNDPGESPDTTESLASITGEDPGYVPGETETLPEVVVTASRIPSYVPVENPLHDYATYTYNISLFALSSDEYNQAVTNEVRWDRVGKCLIGGAGRFNDNSSRHPAFRDDFYFDGLRLNTIVGMNARTKASNAIEITFNIVEPYGLTLLDRIIDLAATIKPSCRNYLELPYALRIDFFGATDEGEMPNPIPNMTKWFPVKLLELKMKVGTKGTEYSIRAVPYNHQALQESTATTPINLEIDAKTVQDFFDEGEAVVAETDELAAFREAVKLDTVRNDSEALQAYQARIKELEKGLKVKSSSYTAGVNAWYQYQIETGAREYTDRIRFVVDKEIADSAIVLPDRTDPSKTPVPDPGTAKSRVANAPNAVGPDFKATAFSVSAGTSVPRLVDMVMRNSSYILDQVSDPATKSPEEIANKRGKPLNWYKIIPSIKLDKFDIKTNRWARTITYHIKPYVVYNSKHPMGPQSRPEGFVKIYNYMYTGLNSDIIDFSIDFDTLFYTAIEVNRASYQTTSGAARTTTQNKPNEVENPSQAGSIQQVQYLPIPDNPGASAALDGNRDPTTKTAASIQNSIYSGARGDMLNLRLKIIGDPHFIKQDDVLINPADPEYDAKIFNQFSENGSLIMDAGEIYARVNFRTPVDIDDKTGLVRSDGRYVESKFSGLYRILKVESEFRSGRFEQTLDMIRIFDDILEAATTEDSREIEEDPEGGAVSVDVAGENSSGVVVEDTSDDENQQDDDPADTNTNGWGEENEPWDPDSESAPPSDFDEDPDLEDISDQDEDIDIEDDRDEMSLEPESFPVTSFSQQEQIQAQADINPGVNDPVTGPVTTNSEITQTVSTVETTGGGVTTRTADTSPPPQTQEQLTKDLEYDIMSTKRSLSFYERRGNTAKVAELNSKLSSLESQLASAQGN
jgi:hypothetical protein